MSDEWDYDDPEQDDGEPEPFDDERSIDDQISDWLDDHGYEQVALNWVDREEINNLEDIRGNVFANIEDVLEYLNKAPVLFDLASVFMEDDLFYLAIPDDTSPFQAA